MSGIVEWTSTLAYGDDDTKYFVSKYIPRIRKSVALVRHAGVNSTVVAYFVSEDAARRFCKDVLGGIIERDRQG